MPLVEMISHADGSHYIRSGVCDGCKRPNVRQAQCCTFLSITPVRTYSQDEQKWLALHPGLETDGTTITVNVACSALTADGNCSLFDKPERPEMCVRYPELPAQVLDGCAYLLTEVSPLWQL